MDIFFSADYSEFGQELFAPAIELRFSRAIHQPSLNFEKIIFVKDK
jgi:hypothetical protein